MAIRYFATNRDLTNLGRAVSDYKARIQLQRGDHRHALRLSDFPQRLQEDGRLFVLCRGREIFGAKTGVFELFPQPLVMLHLFHTPLASG